VNEFFRKFAAKAAEAMGSSWSFLMATAIIVVWALTGPLFIFRHLAIGNQYRDNDHYLPGGLLIQNTQNRDAKGIHLKLDELIKATKGARNDVINLDILSDEQLKH